MRAAAILADLARETGSTASTSAAGIRPRPRPRAARARRRRGPARRGFGGRLLLEPGRAIVADAVDLAFTVVAVKRLADDTRCVIVDAGTNLLAGTLWAWPRIELAGPARGRDEPTLVTGPLCLNVDVLAPAAPLPVLGTGDVLLARAVGAYQQSQSTGFGEPRPAVAGREDGRWRLVQRGETIADLIAGDIGPPAGISIEEAKP